MDNEDITGAGIPGDPHMSSSAPAPTVAPVTPQVAESMTLAELNTATGKTFPNKEAALKSIQDTISYVGKKKEDIEREVLARVQNTETTTKLAGEVESLRKDMFYKDNPQYASYRGMIEKIGGNPAETVNLPEFKDVFIKASGYDESQKLKTVLESNPRLASSKDSLQKAQEIRDKNMRPDGQLLGNAKEEVERLTVNAVKDAFGL